MAKRSRNRDAAESAVGCERVDDKYLIVEILDPLSISNDISR
jgi:hypothetical protein